MQHNKLISTFTAFAGTHSRRAASPYTVRAYAVIEKLCVIEEI